MFNKRPTHIVIALCTAFALIAFAVYQHYRPINVQPVNFFWAAAVISLAPALYRSVRHKGCQRKLRNS